MIIVVKLFLIFVFLMISFISFDKYQSITITRSLERDRVKVKLNSNWNNDQFQQFSNPPISFSKNQIQFVIQAGGKKIISFQKLGFTQQDAENVNKVTKISQTVFQISGPYFLIVYCYESEKIIYERYGVQHLIISFYVSDGKLWTLSFPSNRVLLNQVFQLQTGNVVHSRKELLSEKIQLIQQVIPSENVLKIKTLAFSRNLITISLNRKTYQIVSKDEQKSSQMQYNTEQFSNYFVKWKIDAISTQFQSYLQQILFYLSFGNFGQMSVQASSLLRQKQSSYYFQVLDTSYNCIIGLNSDSHLAHLQSLGPHLIPLRTPIFHHNPDEILPFDEAIQKQQNKEGSMKFTGYFKDTMKKQYEDMKGVYRLNPDANVHFLAFDKNYLYFSPKQNLRSEDYHMIRTKEGGIVMKGNELKGSYDKLPISNKKDSTIKYGYASDQAYQQLTTNGIQVTPYIFEAHLGYKSLFSYKKNNKIQLINGLNGQSLLTHYLSKGYQYSNSFIQNNEYWIFEHSESNPALITKYQLYVNSSSPRTVLYIKRLYPLQIKGKIESVQRCIDSFYYFQYTTFDKNSYGIARIHQLQLNNRQPLSHSKYAGKFQAEMIIDDIASKKQMRVDPLQEQWVLVQMEIGSPIISSWKSLKLKHQYFVLPYKIYKKDDEIFVFDVRHLTRKAFDLQKIETKKKVYFIGCSVSVLLSALLVFFTFIKEKIFKNLPLKSDDSKKFQKIQEEEKKRRKEKKSKSKKE